VSLRGSRSRSRTGGGVARENARATRALKLTGLSFCGSGKFRSVVLQSCNMRDVVVEYDARAARAAAPNEHRRAHAARAEKSTSLAEDFPHRERAPGPAATTTIDMVSYGAGSDPQRSRVDQQLLQHLGNRRRAGDAPLSDAGGPTAPAAHAGQRGLERATSVDA
jgi:hypothetical protein